MTHDFLNDKDYPTYVRIAIDEMVQHRKEFKAKLERHNTNTKIKRSGFDALLEKGLLSDSFDIMNEITRCINGVSRLPLRERTFIRGLTITAASKLIVARNRQNRKDNAEQ